MVKPAPGLDFKTSLKKVSRINLSDQTPEFNSSSLPGSWNIFERTNERIPTVSKTEASVSVASPHQKESTLPTYIAKQWLC